MNHAKLCCIIELKPNYWKSFIIWASLILILWSTQLSLVLCQLDLLEYILYLYHAFRPIQFMCVWSVLFLCWSFCCQAQTSLKWQDAREKAGLKSGLIDSVCWRACLTCMMIISQLTHICIYRNILTPLTPD